MPARIHTDEQALKEAADLQSKSKDAAVRMQQRLQETQDMGVTTLEELYERRRQLEAIEAETDRMHHTLDETEEMQTKLGGWFSFDWLLPSHKTMRSVEEHTAIGVGTSSNNEPTSTRNPKKLWKKLHLTRRPNNEKVAVEPEAPKGLLDGVDVEKSDYKEELKALDRRDKELDNHLDTIGLQLEHLTAMAEEIGQETNRQTDQMGNLKDNMIDVHFRQYEAIDRTKQFLGDARRPQKEESMVPKPSLF